MELRYKFTVLIGIICIVVLGIVFLICKNRKNAYKNGIRAANSDLLSEESFFKRKLLSYRILKWMLAVFITMGILFTCVLMAQPYSLRVTKENKYNRDIIICLDVSTSVDELNKKLVTELEDTVKGLSGERVGIVIFNTSPVLVAPLTDDYEYIIEQLENIRKALSVSNGMYFDDDWFYWSNYLYSGTLVDNDERGSSLIGDGLLSAAFSFFENESEGERTKIIIFSTDNEKNGEGFVTLSEASKICRQNHIIVYGIGTKNMLRSNMDEMKSSVELTGGRFYIEENKSTFYRITKEIESKSAGLVKGRTVINKVPRPELFFCFLVICVAGIIVCEIILRQEKPFVIIRQTLPVLLLIAIFVTVVYPAKNTVFDEGQNIAAQSELRVLFVIDDTLSMLANDAGPGKTQRLKAVKKDCVHILEELEGAEFAVISFNNQATLMSPYTTNTTHIQNVIDSLYPMETWYARGSSLNTPKELMLQNLKNTAEKNRNKTAVFFISDGEITNESTLDSYQELAQYINGGAVMGYGTKKGGTMIYEDSYLDKTEKNEIMDYTDYPVEPAVSKIDEDNLKSIAADLDITYVPMQDDIALDAVLSVLKKNLTVEPVKEKEDAKDNTEDATRIQELKTPLGYWLLFPLFFLLLAEGWIFVTVQNR